MDQKREARHWNCIDQARAGKERISKAAARRGFEKKRGGTARPGANSSAAEKQSFEKQSCEKHRRGTVELRAAADRN